MTRILTLLVVLVLAILAAGCARDKAPQGQPTTSPTATTSASTTTTAPVTTPSAPRELYNKTSGEWTATAAPATDSFQVSDNRSNLSAVVRLIKTAACMTLRSEPGATPAEMVPASVRFRSPTGLIRKAEWSAGITDCSAPQGAMPSHTKTLDFAAETGAWQVQFTGRGSGVKAEIVVRQG